MAGSRVKGITIEINGDTKGLDKALSGVNSEANKTAAELKDVNKLLKLDPGNTTLVQQKFDLMKTAVMQTEEKLKTLESAEKQVNQAFKNGDLGESQYRSFQRELESTRGQLKNTESGVKELDQVLKGTKSATESAETGFKQAKTSLNGLGTEAQDTSTKLEGIASKINTFSMQGFANGAQQAGQGLKAFGERTLDAFREVDEGMDTVVAKSSLTSDETSKLFSTLNTEVPGTNFQAMGDAVGGLNQQFGFTGKALETNSAYLLKFASVNNTDVAPSIKGAQDAMALFQMDASQLPSVLDSVSNTSKNTGLSVDTIWSSLQNGAPALQNMGLNLDQSVQMLGMFESSGVDANGAIAALTKGATNFAKDGKTLSQGLQEVGQKMKETKDPAEQMSIAVDTFGAKAGPRMLDMLRNGKLSLEDFGKASSSVDSVGKTFEAQLDPIDQMTSTQNDAKMAMAELGGEIQTALAPILKALSSAIKGLAGFFGDLPGPVKTVAAAFVLIVTGILLLMPVIMGIAAPIMLFGTASGGAAVGVGALSGALLPIIGVIAAVIVIIGLIVLAVKHWGDIVAWLKGVWQGITEFFGNIGQGIGQIFNNIGQTIQNVWNGVVNFVQSIPEKIQSFFAGIAEWFSNTFTAVGNGIHSAWDTVVSFIQSIPQIIMNFFNGVVAFYSGVFQSVGNAIHGAWDAVISFIQGIPGRIQNFFSGIGSFFSGIFNDVKTGVTNRFDEIVTFIQDIPGKIVGFFESIPDKISGVFKNIHIPTLHVKGGFDLNPAHFKVPSIEFYAKGGVFTKPTLFANSGSVVGEAGAEAVLPLNDKTYAGIGAGIGKFLSGNNIQIIELLQQLISVVGNQKVVLETGALVGGISDSMNYALGEKTSRTGKGRAS
ncbi:phage tail tape measure protein [Lactovum odontotermitis]